jgi:iron complex outermembrane receptor protein
MIISQEDILKSPVSDINELLDYSLGVDVRQRGANGVQADASIRGGSFEQTLILLNGIKINDPQTGHHNLDIPVDLSSVERIEILEGSGARIYGPNAFAGAINIITKNPDNDGVKATISGGDYKLFEGSAGGYFNCGKIKTLVEASHKSSAGYRDNTDYQISGLFLQSTASTGKGDVQFQAGLQDKAFGANSFYTAKYPNQFENTKTLFSSLKWNETIAKIHISPQVYYRRHQDRFELFRNNAPTWYSGHNYHLTHVYGTQINSWFAWSLGKTSLGAEYRVENIQSNVLGEPTGDTIRVPFESSGKFTKEGSRENVSFFIDHTFSTPKFSASAGVLTYWNSDFGFNFYPGIDLGYSITQNIRLIGSVNKTLRLPTYTDLYYKDPSNIGNPNLVPEQATNYETGVKFNSKKFIGGISVFYRDGKNTIDWVRLTNTSLWESANITAVKTWGAETYGRMDLSKLKSACPITNIQLNYSWINLEKATGNYYSKYALDMLRNKVSLQIDHKIWKNLTAGWRVVYQERMGTYTEFSTGKEKEYVPFVTMDGRISWKQNSFLFFVQASNIFNTGYIDMANIPMPGRWAKAGISMDLNLDKTRK